MSTEQRENLEAILRQSAFPVDSDVNQQRRQLRELASAQPLPAELTGHHLRLRHQGRSTHQPGLVPQLDRRR